MRRTHRHRDVLREKIFIPIPCIKKERPTLIGRSNGLMVRLMGLEPIRAFAHYPLKVARLPFRHNRMCNCWCSGTELNRRHGDFQSPALPTELPEQNMATPIGFEPTIFAVTGRHVKPLHHGAVSYFSERLAFRQKLFYHVPALLASTFFIIFAEHPFFFFKSPL